MIINGIVILCQKIKGNPLKVVVKSIDGNSFNHLVVNS